MSMKGIPANLLLCSTESKKEENDKEGAKETETSKKIQIRKKVCGKEKSLRYIRHNKKKQLYTISTMCTIPKWDTKFCCNK